tara:strand:+ start:4241 stop:4405 length:165 start_codon:yes stop_codon:yes gene_type:complete
MQRPGVIEIMKKTGMKKYNKVKSNIMRINLSGNNNDKKDKLLHIKFLFNINVSY